MTAPESPYDELLACLDEQYAKTARFVKTAFHVHTIDSYDWGKEAGSTVNDPALFRGPDGQDRFLAALEQAGLELVCITDHMKAGYAAELSERAAQGRGVVILPGLELNVSVGPDKVHFIHVLAIFPSGTPTDVIERVWGVQPEIPGTTQRTGREVAHFDTLSQLRANVRDAGGLFVLAHVDQDPRGHRAHFRAARGQTGGMFAIDVEGAIHKTEISNEYAGYLIELDPDAVELMKAEDRRHYLRVTGPDRRTRSFAGVARSDHHSVEAFAERDAVTYVKVSRRDLGCVRQALNFHRTRIRFPEDVQTSPSPRIVGIRIRGGGLFEDAAIAFNENLNCLIGARGSGKSTVIEALRYALGQRAPLEQVRTSAGDERSYAALALATQDANLRDSEIELIYERSGEQHILSATFGVPTKVFTLDGSDRRVPPEAISSSYPARIFSWSELETLGREPRLQRAVVDRLAPDLARLEAQQAERWAEIDANRRGVVALREELTALLAADGGTLRRFTEYRLRFERLNTDEARELFAELDRRRRRISLLREVDGSLQALQERLDGLARDDPERSVSELIEGEQEDVRDWWRDDVAETIDLDGLGAVLAAVATAASEVRRRREVLAGLLAHEGEGAAAAEGALRDQTRADAGAAVARDQRERARELYEEASDLRERFLAVLQSLRDALRVRDELLRAIAAGAAEIAEARRAVAVDLGSRMAELGTDVKVTVEVAAGADRAAWVERLHEFLDPERGGQYKHKQLPERLAAFTPPQVVEAILKQNAAALVGGDDAGPVRDEEARRLVGAFDNLFSTDEEADVTCVAAELDELLALQQVAVDDLVRIHSDGQPVDELSPGGRSSAMLPLIALSDDVPLIIDQPEDNLDNRMVGRTLSEILARLKETRQIIVTTHNPNIVVGGDAEQVVVLKAPSARTAEVAATGSIDDDAIIDSVIKIMEGGEEAFKERERRYEEHLSHRR